MVAFLLIVAVSPDVLSSKVNLQFNSIQQNVNTPTDTFALTSNLFKLDDYELIDGQYNRVYFETTAFNMNPGVAREKVLSYNRSVFANGLYAGSLFADITYRDLGYGFYNGQPDDEYDWLFRGNNESGFTLDLGHGFLDIDTNISLQWGDETDNEILKNNGSFEPLAKLIKASEFLA